MFVPRRLDDQFSVAPQIAPEDVAAVKDAGFAMLVNNRPDGEAPGQPSGERIAAAAGAAGIGYRAIPVAGGYAEGQLDALGAAMTTGPVLAFCTSGTRSCQLWALTRARAGDDPDGLIAKARGAGYDLTGLRPLLERLAEQG